jgi:Flp pilus assembly protein TadD
MKRNLRELEISGKTFYDAGDYGRAFEIFSAIAEQQPDWEHGRCYYEMALCCEELERFVEAEKFFRSALKYEPQNDFYLGGLASFLYVHGDPKRAFDAHIELSKLKLRQGDQAGVRTVNVALEALGHKIGMTDKEILELIERLKSQNV